jgi:hypothetical protein
MRILLALLALLLLVGALIALAPASLVDARIAGATGGAIRLADAAGTAWWGQGRIAEARGRWQVPIAWHIDPFALLRGRVVATLPATADSAVRGYVVAASKVLQVHDLHLRIPAAALESAWPQPPVPRLDGTIELDGTTFRIDGMQGEGALDARWVGARALMAGATLDLGTVAAHARPAEDGISIVLSNRGGDLALAGTLDVRSGALSLDATLTPSAALSPPMALLLRSLGPATPAGAIHVTWQGQP